MNLIINASAHNIPLTDKSVHAIVTSSPYYGLREYEGNQVIHWPHGAYCPTSGSGVLQGVPAMSCALGAEQTIQAFIWHLLLIFRECRRVLRDDGVCWFNLGDSSAGVGKSGGGKQGQQWEKAGMKFKGPRNGNWCPPPESLEAGNLLGIPHRFMLAAQADGWIIRNDCIWSKMSLTPESVSGRRWVRHKIKTKKGKIWRHQAGLEETAKLHLGDGDHHAKWEDCPGCEKCLPNDGMVLETGSWRHTRATEHVFMMTKQMNYWSNGDLVREPATYAGDNRKARAKSNHKSMPTDLHAGINPGEQMSDPKTRNPRNVLSPPPSPYSGAHYAPFPKELVRPLILSSVPQKCCVMCGTGWAPIVQRSVSLESGSGRSDRQPNGKRAGGVQTESGQYDIRMGPEISSWIQGYRPSCECGTLEHKPGIVLDPFLGAGTTLEVARECLVDGIGLDISLEYLTDHASWRSGEHKVDPRAIEKMPLFAGWSDDDQ